jgi:hypothetical protein
MVVAVKMTYQFGEVRIVTVGFEGVTVARRE